MKKYFFFFLAIALTSTLFNCDDNDDFDFKFTESTGKSITYDLGSKDVEGISGTVTFVEIVDGSVNVNIDLSGTPDGGVHPAHIHLNNAAEGGDIVLSLASVDGDSGNSTINVKTFDDGSPFTYDSILEFDGYVNVHLSAEELGTIVAQGDIGQNDLTDNSITYDLTTKDVEGISGTATFTERNNGEILGELDIEGTPEGGVHPAHIHANTALETGGILFSFNPVDGNSGKSFTNIISFDDGSSLPFSDISSLDAYINVHLGTGADLATIVAQGDIGENDLTGETIEYDLGEKDVDDISGTATFSERNNGEALVKLKIENTIAGAMHPAHIHENAAVEGGDILFSFNPVNGDTGISFTNLANYDDASDFGYSDISDLNAYINVHLGAGEQLSTIVAQGDIGENDLTGETIEYDLGEKDVDDISGTATFSERNNGEALVKLKIENTIAGAMHPAHIHENAAIEGGDILFSFNPVNGDTGISFTNLANYDDASDFEYSDILDLDAYINVHLGSGNQLSTIVAQGDIGENDLTGEVIVYDLGEKDIDGISGTATISERNNGEALAELKIRNTIAGVMHPAHIHENTAAEGGDILFSFNPVNGDTGISITNLASLNDDSVFGYSDILDLDAYINVHLGAGEQLSTIVSQGDIGKNDLTGESKSFILAEKDVPNIFGTATFFKRKDNSTLVVLDIKNTVPGASHPAHIHENDAATTGPIAFSFNPVNGTTGMSVSQIEKLDNNDSITYNDLLTYNGYINVHLGPGSDLSVIVAQGNIGSN